MLLQQAKKKDKPHEYIFFVFCTPHWLAQETFSVSFIGIEKQAKQIWLEQPFC